MSTRSSRSTTSAPTRRRRSWRGSQAEFGPKLRVFHYLPKVHPPGSDGHAREPADSPASFVNQSNFALTADALPRRDEARRRSPGDGRTRLAALSQRIRGAGLPARPRCSASPGINLARDEAGDAAACSPPSRSSGAGDHFFFEVTPETHFIHDPRFEDFGHGGKRRVFADFTYWHLKYLKPDFGFANRDIDDGGNPRFERKREAFLADRRVMSLTTLLDAERRRDRPARVAAAGEDEAEARRWRVLRDNPPVPDKLLTEMSTAQEQHEPRSTKTSITNGPEHQTHRRGLVLGALTGKRVGAPTVFVESLIASGTDADAVIFCCDISNETERYLRSRGIKLIPFRFSRWWHGAIHSRRFVLFARYAAEQFQRYDYIMTSDLRDVVIQSDPFAEIDDPAVHFFLENANTIGSERFNAKWMRRFIPRRLHADYAKRQIACAGVVIGGARTMADYLAAVARRVSKVGILQRRHIGADAAMHNLIAHLTHDVPGLIVENNGLVATMGLEPPGTYRVGNDGFIRCADGHAPAICHQYDRIAEVKALVEQRYAIVW